MDSCPKIDFSPDAAEDIAVRRGVGILLLIALTAVCSGALGFFHCLDYDRQLSQWLAAHHGPGSPAPIPFTPHDESNCLICLILHLPLSTAAIQPAIAALGLLAMAIALGQPIPTFAKLILTSDDRGPPLR